MFVKIECPIIVEKSEFENLLTGTLIRTKSFCIRLMTGHLANHGCNLI